MTEANMKQTYDDYISKGMTEQAKAISNIPRYAKFAQDIPEPIEPSPEPEELKPKKKKGKS